MIIWSNKKGKPLLTRGTNDSLVLKKGLKKNILSQTKGDPRWLQ